MNNVLGRAAQALEQMAIIRVDDRTAPREIRKQVDRTLAKPEFPRLGVVTRGGQRSEADQLAQVERAAAVFQAGSTLR